LLFRRRLLPRRRTRVTPREPRSCQGRRSRRREAFTAPRDPAVRCRFDGGWQRCGRSLERRSERARS
jgi:hypothetical protein